MTEILNEKRFLNATIPRGIDEDYRICVYCGNDQLVNIAGFKCEFCKRDMRGIERR